MGWRTRSAADRSASGRLPPQGLPEFSPRLYRGFIAYLRSYFARNFTGVRTSGSLSEDAAWTDSRPLIFYANHPSWWDPIHFGLLASYLLPERRVYGPMDADMLEKYRIFKKLGVFGVDRSRRGAASFLSASQAVLAEPATSLWMTVEGSFADPRQRPLEILPGLAHLASRLSDGWVVPLALEYPFWNERQP
ncbi:MAG: lysophospholipid acyltransferase family protein, partial [Acidobacteriota bacterium]